MTPDFGAEIEPFATPEQVATYVGPTRAAEIDEGEIDRLIQRASEIIYEASGRLAVRAVRGLLFVDPLGGYIDPNTTPSPILVADYQFALALATSAQVEFWMEWGEDHGIVGLKGSAQSGKVMVSRLPNQLAPRAQMHLSAVGLLGTRASIR